MKEIIVRACAIIASWIALFAPGALALPVDSGMSGSADVYENFMRVPVDGYAQTTGLRIHTLTGEPGTDASGSEGMFFERPDGLSTGIVGDETAGGCYIDPATMCVAIKCIEAYPTGAYGTGLFRDERLCPSEDRRTPMPVPGTMFVIGLGLLGLSTLKKRNPHIMSLARKADRSEDNSFFPARILAVEACTPERGSSVVPIGTRSYKKIALKETERYRTLMKSRHMNTRNVRKEMAG